MKTCFCIPVFEIYIYIPVLSQWTIVGMPDSIRVDGVEEENGVKMRLITGNSQS